MKKTRVYLGFALHALVASIMIYSATIKFLELSGFINQPAEPKGYVLPLEWSEASGMTMTIRDPDVPVSPDIRGACELLGLDPLHVVNEGTMVIAVERDSAQATLDVLHASPDAASAAVIGAVVPKRISPVTIVRQLGSEQPLDDPLGAPLPRIC